jgi:NAD(P)H-dependent FMN reductase
VDDAGDDHPKVKELRELAQWTEGMVWCSPERHGAMTGLMKTQIDWIPLSSGAVRPTQGKTLAVMQVSGGSQSFNAVNQMRVLGRWMRMLTIPNQSSVAKAYQEFDETGRMKPSAYYDRIVDVMEELMKFTLLTRDAAPYLVDRYSERKESAEALMPEPAAERDNAWRVFLVFLRLGLTSFGGPIAHLGYFRTEFVERRRWLDDRSYADLVALCQFLPGPASSQVGMALGLGRAGWVGRTGGLARIHAALGARTDPVAYGVAEYRGWLKPAGCTGSRSWPWPWWRKRCGAWRSRCARTGCAPASRSALRWWC